MRTLNNKGQIVILFVLLAPLLVLLLVISTEFSRLVITKIHLQGTIDKAMFAGASFLADQLNQIAKADRKVHEEFLRLQKTFRNLSKKNPKEAKVEIDETWRKQNKIFDEEIMPAIEQSYAKAYAIAEAIVQKEFPSAHFAPFYLPPLEIGEGRVDLLHFDEIKGVTFDPRGYRRVASKEFEARMAFVKNDHPNQKMALAGGLEVQAPTPLLSLLNINQPLRAVAAAQPYGGSIWGYALTKDQQKLYRTTFVPLATLPREGFKNVWEDFHAYQVEH